MTAHAGLLEGERRRDLALSLTAPKHEAEIAAAQARMLAAALERGDGTYTSDDATEPGAEYANNAGWLGAAVRGLALRPWTAETGHYPRSTRPSRKANRVCAWRITDRHAAATELARLRAKLEALAKVNTSDVAADLPLFQQTNCPLAAATANGR